MNKHDWIWVALRIFGIFLLVLVITNLPDFFVSGFKYHLYGSQYTLSLIHSGIGASSCEEVAKRMEIISMSELMGSTLKILIFGSFGLYFIRGGKFIFNIISSTGTSNK